MYLEENDPTLEAAILSAIEATSGSIDRARITRRISSTSWSSRRSTSAAASSRTSRRQARAQAPRDDARRRRRRRAAARHARPGVPAPRPVGAARRHARRGEVEPVLASKSSRATRRSRADPISRSRRKLVGLHVEGSDADGAQLGRARSSSAFRSSPAPNPADVRRHALPSRQGHRVLRRVERREVADVHDDGARSADRRQARARIPLPRLHGPARAEDRHRRRRRRAARHGSLDAHHADDDVAGREDRA